MTNLKKVSSTTLLSIQKEWKNKLQQAKESGNSQWIDECQSTLDGINSTITVLSHDLLEIDHINQK